ncbi:hypothetical protein BdWA1_003282 [Babesia duncani]|uniref:Uncharacterized protein n=1 Tax=Babesia duncani TaxID=323732 RepID=A0AAD9PIP5_9APIC|nr:hypothetical protein BdWA1_003282 [Babesia duncani]
MSDGGEIYVDESENELTVEDLEKEVSNMCIETADTADMSIASLSEDELVAADAENAESKPDGFVEQAVSLAGHSWSILKLEDVPRELGELQKYCSNKLKDLVSTNDKISELCISSFAPQLSKGCLAIADGCTHFESLLTLGSGCFGAEEPSHAIDPTGTEFKLADPEAKKDSMEPATTVTGVWFVDTINSCLDTWTTNTAQEANHYNIFKLLNLSALLKYLGDATTAEKIKVLGQQKLLAIEPAEKQRRWQEILANMETKSSTPLNPEALPVLPNAHVASPCPEQLKDIAEADIGITDERLFNVYWHYTDKWLKDMIGPSFRVSKDVVAGTKRWFSGLGGSTKTLFIKLSKTLSCAQ